MATTYELRTFADLYTAVMEEMKVQSGDTVTKNRIKRDLNIIYQQEVVPYSAWKWKRREINLSIPPFYNTGTVNTNLGDTATLFLSDPPSFSKKGYLISIDGQREVYRIAQHTSGDQAVRLSVPYTGAAGSEMSYKIWSDRVYLPPGATGVHTTRHAFMDKPVEDLGLNEFRRLVQMDPKRVGRPYFQCLGDSVDPAPFAAIAGMPAVASFSSSNFVKTLTFAGAITDYVQENDVIEVQAGVYYWYSGIWRVSSVSGSSLTYTSLVPYDDAGTISPYTVAKLTSETNSESLQELLVYPAITDTRTTLEVDYFVNVPALTNDADEPWMPYEDRAVLLYGALSRDWIKERNPEEAQRNWGLYQKKLNQMASRVDGARDFPVLGPDKTYLAGLRAGYRGRPNSWTSD